MTRPPDAIALRRMVRYVVMGAMAWSIVVAAAMAAWGGTSIAPPSPTFVVWGVAVFALNHLLRFVRWHLMLGAEGYWLPWARSLAIFMAGLALLPTPAKAGVAARSVLLEAEGVPVHVSIAAYFAERLLDLIGLVGLATVLVGSGTAGTRWLVAATVALLGIVAIRIAPAALRAARSRLRLGAASSRALDWAVRCLGDAREMLGGWRLPVFIALGAGANAISGLLIWVAVRGAVDPVTAVGVLAVSHLSGSITLLPGGLGGFDLAMVTQLDARGVAPGEALAALSLVRLSTFWAGIAVGMPLLWLGLRRGPAREEGA
ncbi:MAG TPA: lysylphosphatidylglycerol synthase transmembrane domain-containing protein [Usitatibacter sp.]|nr:lysylphosphatidylglycerol synthase transmembrane domain-containing protein [Usitatibacter sp.]